MRSTLDQRERYVSDSTDKERRRRFCNDIYNSFMHNDIENICFGGGLNIFPSPPWSSVKTLLIWSF